MHLHRFHHHEPWPASTASPAATSTRTTLPGMGADTVCTPSPPRPRDLRLTSAADRAPRSRSGSRRSPPPVRPASPPRAHRRLRPSSSTEYTSGLGRSPHRPRAPRRRPGGSGSRAPAPESRSGSSPPLMVEVEFHRSSSLLPVSSQRARTAPPASPSRAARCATRYAAPPPARPRPPNPRGGCGAWWRCEELLDEAGVQVAGAEFRVFQNLAEEADVGADAAHVVFAQRADHALGGVLARRRPRRPAWPAAGRTPWGRSSPRRRSHRGARPGPAGASAA